MSAIVQKQVFLNSEGDQYYKRNKTKLALNQLATNDRMISELKKSNVRPHAVLEIGCSNRWRLEALRGMYQAKCFGLDPSSEAIDEGRQLFPDICFQKGTADQLPFGNDSFDLVIFGFCLYLCDRSDLFLIAYEADRVLTDAGHIVVLDFCPSFPSLPEWIPASSWSVLLEDELLEYVYLESRLHCYFSRCAYAFWDRGYC